MPRVRYGVVLVIPAPFDHDIDVLRHALGDEGMTQIMPHVTLVAPVNVSIDRADECLEILRVAAADFQPFTTRIGPVATFTPVTPVVYLSVTEHELTERLKDSVSKGPFDIPPDYEFVPHVSLVEDVSDEKIAAAMRSLDSFSIEVVFDRVSLLQKESGQPWRSVAEFQFGSARKIGTGGLEVTVDSASVVNAEVQAFLDREWKPWLNTNLGQARLEFEPVVIAARREGEIVGVLRAEFRSPAGHMRELLIAASARGQGIARHLLNEFDVQARERNATRLTTNILHGCEAEHYMRHLGWADDNESLVVEFDREMVRLTKTL